MLNAERAHDALCPLDFPEHSPHSPHRRPLDSEGHCKVSPLTYLSRRVSWEWEPSLRDPGCRASSCDCSPRRRRLDRPRRGLSPACLGYIYIYISGYHRMHIQGHTPDTSLERTRLSLSLSLSGSRRARPRRRSRRERRSSTRHRPRIAPRLASFGSCTKARLGQRVSWRIDQRSGHSSQRGTRSSALELWDIVLIYIGLDTLSLSLSRERLEILEDLPVVLIRIYRRAGQL